MNSVNTIQSPISYESQHRRAMSASSRQSSCYPASPSMEPHSATQAHGLGLQYTMAPPSSTVSPAMATPPQEWPAVSHAVAPAFTASQAPDIFSAAFDPFSGFNTSSTTGMVSANGGHSPEAPGLEFCTTPTSSNLASHRGSVSSYPASDSGSNGAYTPRAKHEDSTGEWYVAGQAPVSYAPPSATEQLYREPSSEQLYRPQGDGYMADLSGKGFDAMASLSATRMRKRRQRTTPEEATHECRVCGKLFKRSYNWKSHMETHNPDRKYPHPCPHSVGNSACSKKFQRKTDLDRHVDSVHLKSRNHKCNLCGNRFARRDTLRRHSEDGCPKRFELNLREGSAPPAASHEASPAPPARWSFSAAPGPVAFAPRMPPHAMSYGGFHPQAVYSN